jgi:hypothetical protein
MADFLVSPINVAQLLHGLYHFECDMWQSSAEVKYKLSQKKYKTELIHGIEYTYHNNVGNLYINKIIT